MALGKPLLATWSDGTLRMFELSEAGFVQVATTALASLGGDSTNYPPCLHFVRDSQYLVATRGSATSNVSGDVFYPGLSPASGRSLLNGGGVGNHKSAYSPTNNYLAIAPNATGFSGGNTLWTINEAGVLTAVGDAAATGYVVPLLALSLSRDGRFLVRGHNGVSGPSRYFYRPDGAPTNLPFSVNTPLPNITPINIIEWSADSRFVLFGDKTGNVEVWKRDDETLFKIREISDDLGHPVAIAFSPNLRTVAISWQTVGTPTTVIYRRTGNVFQKVQTLSGTFGTLLGFTADGRYLIDAASRRAFEYVEGSFVEAVGLLQNVNTGSTVQVISTHMDVPRGIGFFYDGAVPGLTSGTIDPATLKIALLSADASFQQSNGTLSEVTGAGAYEVYGSGWPQGGKQLTGAQRQSFDPSSLSITFDDVTQIIVEDTLRFRYAVIYDGADEDGRPVIFIDFQTLQRAEKDSELKMTFDSFGLIVYSA